MESGKGNAQTWEKTQNNALESERGLKKGGEKTTGFRYLIGEAQRGGTTMKGHIFFQSTCHAGGRG